MVSGVSQGESVLESLARETMRRTPRRSSTLWSQLLRSLQRVSRVWEPRLLRMRSKLFIVICQLALSAYFHDSSHYAESKFGSLALAFCYLLLMIQDCIFLSAWNFDMFVNLLGYILHAIVL
ncbi:Os02g0717800 [Oryza sativa Japonica Group]|uniref:Os02g0717800 protein n=1 Tax=Oryza sativa subsp. japonica TaxID=39947 RepID=A0A0N7KFZ9_ORYSJ|nr:hypothetical protein EE612_013305 [Oryza sativa]BAS80625.1 Os02g0717800 [Oryza sativa Japonica Group]